MTDRLATHPSNTAVKRQIHNMIVGTSLLYVLNYFPDIMIVIGAFYGYRIRELKYKLQHPFTKGIC